jgi:ATP-dependent RNA helicase RhlE
LRDELMHGIADLGFHYCSPIQGAILPHTLQGHDAIGKAQTGTGKTAAFLITIFNDQLCHPLLGERFVGEPRALVIAPTRELVMQIAADAEELGKYTGLQVATLIGGMDYQKQLNRLTNNVVDLVVATPGRLLDFMGRRDLYLDHVEILVLDEADRMLDMGFLPSIRQIVRSLPTKRQTLLFSATLSKEIEVLTHEFQHAPKLVQIGRRANPAETVTQLVYEVPKHLKPALLVHLLRDPGMNMVLVFSRMKHSADRVARHLEQKGVRTATLHSNRSQNQRLRALKDFKSGAVRVLVATDIAARGIDVDGISHVVNYDFPMHAEDYVHRIGRTGRAHAVGDAISFVTPEDYGELRSLERFIGRGIVRKKAEGFNYAAAAQPSDFAAPQRQQPRPHAASSRPQSRPSGGGAPHGGLRGLGDRSHGHRRFRPR